MSLCYMIVAHEIEARCIVLGEQKRREMRRERETRNSLLMSLLFMKRAYKKESR